MDSGAETGPRSDERSEAAERAEPSRRVDLQALVIDASTTLNSANPDELGTKLVWTLASVAPGVEADFAAVFADVADGGGPDGTDPAGEAEFERVHAWSADDDLGEGEGKGSVAAGIRPLLSEVRGGGNVRFTRRGADRPVPEPGREARRAAGVESVLAVPVVREYELWGVLAFAGRSPRGPWADHEVELVRSLADLIASSQVRVERERRIAARNDRLDDFASVVSHDLRNPLNVLRGSIDLAEETDDPEHFERARRAADRMDGIVDDVLDLARAGRDIGETRPTAVADAARTAWDVVDTGVAELSLDAETRVDADADRLVDALSNLFRNAVEHGDGDVTVVVGDRDDEPGGFYVADDGPGFPDDAGDGGDLFERGESGEAGGTGIGLTIVQRVVEAHGWRVTAGESAAGGARFDVVVDG